MWNQKLKHWNRLDKKLEWRTTILWLEYLFYKERLRELGLFRPEKRWLRGHLINAYKYPKGRHHKDGARLSSVLLSNTTRGDGNKLKHGKFHLNNEEKLLWGCPNTGTHWPERGCRVSFCRGGQNTPAMWSCATCFRWAYFRGGWTTWFPKVPFNPNHSAITKEDTGRNLSSEQ